MEIKQRKKGIILVIIGAMLWGVSGNVAQYLFQEKGFNTEWLVAVRLLISGIILLLYAYLKEKENVFEIWKDKSSRYTLAIFCIAGMLGAQYTYFAAIKYGNAATATILQYLSPVIITCYLTMRTKKFPKLREIIAIILALLGTALIVTKGNVHSISISKLGLFWGISSAFSVAFYTLQPKLLLTKWKSSIIVGWGMLIGGIELSFVHAPWRFVGQWTLSSMFGVIFIVLFGTIAAFYLYLESLKYIEPTEASVLSSVEPLSAAFLSIIWLHVSFGRAEWIGTTCIISTVIILSQIKLRRISFNFNKIFLDEKDC